MSEEAKPNELLALTSSIVSAHVSNNSVPVTDLPSLIREVYTTLSSVTGGPAVEVEKPQPAVPVKNRCWFSMNAMC